MVIAVRPRPRATWHKEIAIKVTAFVDEGIAPLVLALNEIPDLVTLESCEASGPMQEAWVCFEYGTGWTDLAELLQRISGFLADPGLACGYVMRLEWTGSNDRPRAQIMCAPEHVAVVADGIRRFASAMTDRRSQSVDGR